MIILILGSSHVRRLSHYISTVPRLANFGLANIQVEYFGISGGRIGRKDDIELFYQQIARVQPEHIILHIGGNDIDVQGADHEYIEEIVLKVVLVAQTFVSRFTSVRSVTVCELFPRLLTRKISVEHYNKLKRHFNLHLKQELKNSHSIQYWKIKGVKGSQVKIFCDGVHLNNGEGMLRYYRSLRGALIQASTM